MRTAWRSTRTTRRGTGAVRRARGQIARQIRLRPAIEAGEHVKPYDTPLIEPDAKRGKAGRRVLRVAAARTAATA